MALHRDLTGNELHEPKGIDVASAGAVYVANGQGSGNWLDRFDGQFIVNSYWLSQSIPDVSTPSSHAYFVIPVRSELTSMQVIIDGALSGTDPKLEIYINGTLFPNSLTLETTGSAAGNVFTMVVTSANTIDPGARIEVRSDGASDGVSKAFVQIGLRAKA